MLERQKILEIAKTLFNENGYFNVTMYQISNHLGISVGNLTYYYPKKADILRGIMAQSLHDVLVPNFYDLTTLNDYFGVLIDSLENERFSFWIITVCIACILKIKPMSCWLKISSFKV